MSGNNEFAYVGSELQIFAHARNWKKYWTSCMRKYLHGDILEVGAGVGTNTVLLRSGAQRRWVCVEPDRHLLAQLQQTLEDHRVKHPCELFPGTIADLPDAQKFDVILYIDVLEHIEDDQAEMSQAVKRLKPGGRIIALSPAHGWLFSEFDSSIGHYRRYTKKTLLNAAPQVLRLQRLVYLDSIGLCASMANRLFLRQSLPTVKQILVWDRFMVPVSRIVDPLAFFSLGKSILAIWQIP